MMAAIFIFFLSILLAVRKKLKLIPKTNANWMNEVLNNYLLVTAISKIILCTILFDFEFEQTYQVAKQTGKCKGLSLLQHATDSFG